MPHIIRPKVQYEKDGYLVYELTAEDMTPSDDKDMIIVEPREQETEP